MHYKRNSILIISLHTFAKKIISGVKGINDIDNKFTC
jgi:hypothetical protein